MQDCRSSIANALELLQSCTKPLIWKIDYYQTTITITKREHMMTSSNGNIFRGTRPLCAGKPPTKLTIRAHATRQHLIGSGLMLASRGMRARAGAYMGIYDQIICLSVAWAKNDDIDQITNTLKRQSPSFKSTRMAPYTNITVDNFAIR